jgi:hypothetical protein
MLADQDVLRTLNSMTKYPSIETYHPLGDKGILQPGAAFFSGSTVVTEKIDGTNFRIILLDDGYFTGSREELLHYGTDVIFNPAQGIVEVVDSVADTMWGQWYEENTDREALTIVYGEVFGGKASKSSKQYTGEGTWDYRIFDVVHYEGDQHLEVASWPVDKISAWRESGGLPFYTWHHTQNFCNRFQLEMVPVFGYLDAIKLPRTIEDTYFWMVQNGFDSSEALIDPLGKGEAEGVVIREAAGTLKRKLRFEDYTRSIKFYNKEAK